MPFLHVHACMCVLPIIRNRECALLPSAGEGYTQNSQQRSFVSICLLNVFPACACRTHGLYVKLRNLTISSLFFKVCISYKWHTVFNIKSQPPASIPSLASPFSIFLILYNHTLSLEITFSTWHPYLRHPSCKHKTIWRKIILLYWPICLEQSASVSPSLILLHHAKTALKTHLFQNCF